MTSDVPALHESRASRRALRAGGTEVDPAAPAARPRPVVVAATVVVALLLAAAAGSGERVLEIVAVVIAGLVVAAGWPRLVGTRSPVGMTLVLMVTALALGAALLLQGEEPYLERVPAALALGVIGMCLHPLVRAPARVHLAQDMAATSLGLLVIAGGGLFVSTDFLGGGGPVVVISIALAVAAVVDLVLERPRAVRWIIPAAMLVGGLAGVLVHALLGDEIAAWPALLGVVGAGAAVSLRRAMSQQAAVDSVLGAVAAGAASVLVVAPLVHLVARLPLA
ncbi:hypothetical protein ASG73_15800 [Janibacter sp. Soil728]|uniref:hypothetical protein n=1 Tax=Janibacter sp. Soil728 TaxID=1736393 RepID=UPI0006F94922|nr:hypothetical protein [Janibacter sp. Soil728]KRE36113.1 hypothetical protein ASG73_15800 [Janibacter sp. Soil728]